MKHEEHEDHEGRGALPTSVEGIASIVIDAGLKVHRALGPGLLDSVYERCLIHELRKRGLSVESQVALPIVYDGDTLDGGLRLDIVVEGVIILEIKAVEALTRLSEAQILTYLRLSRMRLAFLMNFNVPMFKQGLRRFVR
jgi:GxxExxY protein